MVGKRLDAVHLEQLGEVHHLLAAHAVDDTALVGSLADKSDDARIDIFALLLDAVVEVRTVEARLKDPAIEDA